MVCYPVRWRNLTVSPHAIIDKALDFIGAMDVSAPTPSS
ncbi:hypothetical protein ACUODJ_44675, partial [Escherichia sp. HC-CC]